VEVHFFDFCVGSHHEVLAPEKNWEHSIKLQLPAWNVGFMRRLQSFGHFCLKPFPFKQQAPSMAFGSANATYPAIQTRCLAMHKAARICQT
ncbi:hypothetical protein, partial [Pseudomonas syringae]|uniref:hypothetical protein n=1 Tax=Pseudomonas syringae TaxID=317 RepID=UPI001CA5CEC1